jgi:hypothetical protein
MGKVNRIWKQLSLFLFLCFSLSRDTPQTVTQLTPPCLVRPPPVTTPQSPRRRHRKSFKHQSTTTAFLSLLGKAPSQIVWKFHNIFNLWVILFWFKLVVIVLLLLFLMFCCWFKEGLYYWLKFGGLLP